MTDAATETAIAPFGPEHVEGACALSRHAGWPHRMEDWVLNLAVSKGVVALDRGRVVGTAICSPFGEVATMNMIIVAEDQRGRGLGRRLMQAVMALGAPRELRLVATDDGLPLYAKLGFIQTGHIRQHQGIAIAADAGNVRIGVASDLPALIAADQNATGMSRKALLTRIAAEGEMLACDGGFALIRKFGRGDVVGPVIARTPEAARALIAGAATRRAGQFLRIDIPETSGLADFVETLGLAHVGGGVAMSRNARPADPRTFTTFALASQALG